VEEEQPQPTRRIALRVFQAGLVLLFLIAALLGTFTGVLVAFAGDVPEISRLDDYRPNTITRILAREGQTVARFPRVCATRSSRPRMPASTSTSASA
jgi:membrane carboxypeptidase/penicillin-binding protein